MTNLLSLNSAVYVVVPSSSHVAGIVISLVVSTVTTMLSASLFRHTIVAVTVELSSDHSYTGS